MVKEREGYVRWRDEEDALGLEAMVRRTGEHVNRILRENLYEMNLNETQLNRLARQKRELRENLARCGVGDDEAKAYVLEFLQESLLKLFSLTEQNMGASSC